MAGAKAKGPKVEWLFRKNFPKPGEEELHARWLAWIQEEYVCPSDKEFNDDTWQMLFPGEWRKTIYQQLNSMDEFVAGVDRGKRGRSVR